MRPDRGVLVKVDFVVVIAIAILSYYTVKEADREQVEHDMENEATKRAADDAKHAQAIDDREQLSASNKARHAKELADTRAKQARFDRAVQYPHMKAGHKTLQSMNVAAPGALWKAEEARLGYIGWLNFFVFWIFSSSW
jgi:hypothetical protein